MGANFNMKSKKRTNVLVSFFKRLCRLAKHPSKSMPHSSAVEKETSSTATVEEVTGSHLFKIEKFSVQKMNAKGRFLQSATFSVGGHDWSFQYYPNGDSESTNGYASMFLALAGNATDNVSAYWTCTVLNRNGKKLWKHKSSIFTFNSTTNSWGYDDYIEKWVLESGVRKDDCLILKFTVTVVKESLQKCV